MTAILEDRQVQQVNLLAQALGSGEPVPHLADLISVLMSTCVTAARALQAQASGAGLAGGRWTTAQEEEARAFSIQFIRLHDMCENVRRLTAAARRAGCGVDVPDDFAQACIAADFAGPRFEQRIETSKSIAEGETAFTSVAELRDALRRRLDAGGR